MESLKALILAAGKGTRMKSELPKVVHACNGKPMVQYVIEASKEAGADKVCVIVGYKAHEVESAINDTVEYAFQTEQLGTGHAVKCAGKFIGNEGNVIILCGDTPLITGETLKRLVDFHIQGDYGVTVLSAILDDATGYGRIIRDNNGDFQKIVEQKDANALEKQVKEINSGMYVFKCDELSRALDKLDNNNAAGEYYLTDTIEIIKNKGLRVAAMPLKGDDVNQIRGVNTPEQLKEAELIMKGKRG